MDLSSESLTIPVWRDTRRGKVGSGNRRHGGVAAAADSGGAFCVCFTECSQYSRKIAITTLVVQGGTSASAAAELRSELASV